MDLIGDIFEHAVVLSVKMEDQDAFERHFLQLKSYYTDTRYTFSFQVSLQQGDQPRHSALSGTSSSVF